MANQAKKISQLIQKTSVDDADLFVIRDSVSLDNRSVSALNMKSYFGGNSVDWDNINNKPSTFPPSPHTHQLADITDFPTGGNGDIFIHNGTQWAADNVIIIRNISWFQANTNNVLRKNTIVFLEEDRKCFKIGDGVTTLKNLKWYIDRNYGDISITAYSGIFGKNTSTGKYVTHSVFGNSYINSGNITQTNEFRGTFGLLPEPMIVEAIGMKVLSHNASGGSVKFEFGIYQPDFSNKINTLIMKTNLLPIVVGNNIFNLQSPITLPSGVYLFGWRFELPTNSSFILSIVSGVNQLLNVNNDEFGAYSYVSLSGQTSMPTNCGFPSFISNNTIYFLISGQRILLTI